MAPNVIGYGSVGIAEFEGSDLFTQIELFSGPSPQPVTEDFPVGASTTLAAFAVVGLSAAGNLVAALMGSVDPDDDIVPIGITTAPVVTGVGATDRIAIFRAGNFNPAALTWGASYDTDAKKAAAFRGSPAPTNILIRKRL